MYMIVKSEHGKIENVVIIMPPYNIQNVHWVLCHKHFTDVKTRKTDFIDHSLNSENLYK